MSECKKQQTEKTEQKESIEYLGRFRCAVITHLPVRFVPVIKRKKRLDNTGYPEEGQKPCNEHEHLPSSDISTGKMAFGKYYADNKEDNRFHQLKELKSRYVIYKL